MLFRFYSSASIHGAYTVNLNYRTVPFRLSKQITDFQFAGRAAPSTREAHTTRNAILISTITAKALFSPRHLVCYLPNPNEVVGVAGEKSRAIGGPGKRDTLRRLAPGSDLNLDLELVNDVLGLEVPHLDTAGRCRAQPVAVGREDQRVDDVAAFKGVQVLGLVEIPKHGYTVLAAGRAQGTIGGDAHGVDVAGVAEVICAKLALCELPNLKRVTTRRHSRLAKTDNAPTGITARDDDGIPGVRRETDAADPVGVAFVLDIKFALAKGVPQLDGLVSRSTHDLPVVRREGHGHDVVRVAPKLAGGLPGIEVPQAKQKAQTGRLRIRRRPGQSGCAWETRGPSQSARRITNWAVTALPMTAKHIRGLGRRGDGSDPSCVAWGGSGGNGKGARSFTRTNVCFYSFPPAK
ncbi:MAG: hypothetical protein BJ554DRAFT_2561 [Olpidium bornovanus]|uniref:Uncharacterized protein n=1 Tax=Olpidium bornovanus TaxID=278681 RepID=A0A8H8DGC0_9FUNG|nr:MAG: hypothetical protein BJ554DRAFT_2561 [Olpidium bornovanus]